MDASPGRDRDARGLTALACLGLIGVLLLAGCTTPSTDSSGRLIFIEPSSPIWDAHLASMERNGGVPWVTPQLGEDVAPASYAARLKVGERDTITFTVHNSGLQTYEGWPGEVLVPEGFRLVEGERVATRDLPPGRTPFVVTVEAVEPGRWLFMFQLGPTGGHQATFPYVVDAS